MPLTARQVVVLVTGVPAAGKSTVGDLLARRFPRGVHVEGDVFRRMVLTGRVPESAHPSPEALRLLRMRYVLQAATADAYFDAGFSVVVEDVVIGPILRDYVDMIRSRPLCVVALTPRRDVVLAREESRATTTYPDRGELAAVDDALRHGTPRIGLWLESSEQTPEQTVDEILARAWDEARVT